MLRAVFAICLFCFAAAIYSGHRIVAETHLPRSYGPSPIPGMHKSSQRDSIAAIEQEQRIRAAQLAAAETHPFSALGTIMEALRR